MAVELTARIGVEIELLAPVGGDRRQLADAVAHSTGGDVTPFFHPDAEPSKLEGTELFFNLTPGFRVRDHDGHDVVSVVDDVTLNTDLDRDAPPYPGWYRVVSDDRRLLDLAARHCDATAPIETVLDPLAELFSTRPEAGPDGMWRVGDGAGATVAIAAPLPSERERPCELVTPPLSRDHRCRLEALLAVARSLGFVPPTEGAVHLHFDGAPLQSAPLLANLVALLHGRGPLLQALVGTNPECTRLAPWDGSVVEAVTSPGFRHLGWDEARTRLLGAELTKFCDFNLKNLVSPPSGKLTFEVRILPVSLEAEPVLQASRLFQAVLDRATSADPVPMATDGTDVTAAEARAFLDRLDLPPDADRYWAERAAAIP